MVEKMGSFAFFTNSNYPIIRTPPFPGKMIVFQAIEHLHLAELERGSPNVYYPSTVSAELDRGLPNVF